MNDPRNEDAAQESFGDLQSSSTRSLVSAEGYHDNRLQPDALSANVSESQGSGPLLPALSSRDSIRELGELLKQTPLEHLYSSRQYDLSNAGGSPRSEAFPESGSTMITDLTGSGDEGPRTDTNRPQTVSTGLSTTMTRAPASNINESVLGKRTVTGRYRLNTSRRKRADHTTASQSSSAADKETVFSGSGRLSSGYSEITHDARHSKRGAPAKPKKKSAREGYDDRTSNDGRWSYRIAGNHTNKGPKSERMYGPKDQDALLVLCKKIKTFRELVEQGGTDQPKAELKGVFEAMDNIKSGPVENDDSSLRFGFLGQGPIRALNSYVGHYISQVRMETVDQERCDTALRNVRDAFLLVMEAAECTWTPSAGYHPRLTFIGKKAPEATYVNKDDM